MIIHLLFSIIIMIFNTLVSWLPSVSVLPFGMDSLWISSVGYFKGFMLIFPPLEIVYQAFVFYLGFRLLLIVLKVFLGKRVPHHD